MNQEIDNPSKCPICGRPTHKESKYCIFHASAEEKTEREFKDALREYVNKVKKKNKDFDFRSFIFIGKIDFCKDLNITTLKSADFNNAIFEGNVVFLKAIFKEDAVFGNTTFKEFTTFKNATFEGFVDFCNVNFRKYAGFENVTFRGNVNFRKTTFEGNTIFANAVFKKYAGFKNAIFKGDSIFGGATFEGNIGFGCATFYGNTGFVHVIFVDTARFRSVTFKGFVIFVGATFNKIADFVDVKFEVFAGFKGATFKENAYFNIKTNVGKLSFSNAIFTSGKTLKIEIKEAKKEVIVEFKKTYLENIDLELFLNEKVLIDFTGAFLRNTNIQRGQIENHILQEEEGEYLTTEKIFLNLKNNFHGIGQYEDESWAFQIEKDMERKSLSFPRNNKTLKTEGQTEKITFLKWIEKGDFIKWIISSFSHVIYGYGEKPWNVIKSAIIIIFLFGLSFNLIGIANPEIIELNGTAIHESLGNIVEVDLMSKGFLKNNIIRNFPDSIYFSLITFTTLGYGDFRPLEGWGRILAGSEAFIGAFMMALFVYTFARRTGGR